MKFTKLTITGDLGSGKSTIAKKIAETLNCEVFSTVDIQREIAAKHGMTTLQLNEYMKKNPKIDEEIDNFTKSLRNKDESFIMDSRMAWNFIPDSFKIYLKVNPEIASERILKDQIRKSTAQLFF